MRRTKKGGRKSWERRDKKEKALISGSFSEK